jgi:hypothetical protein
MDHHKPNSDVEGDNVREHGRGMPRRPDDERLRRRTEQDRRDVGLPAGTPEPASTQYEEAQEEVDRQTGSGELRAGDTRRKDRDDYPPTRYDR